MILDPCIPGLWFTVVPGVSCWNQNYRRLLGWLNSWDFSGRNAACLMWEKFIPELEGAKHINSGRGGNEVFLECGNGTLRGICFMVV